jgi:hypothetical protein
VAWRVVRDPDGGCGVPDIIIGRTGGHLWGTATGSYDIGLSPAARPAVR